MRESVPDSHHFFLLSLLSILKSLAHPFSLVSKMVIIYSRWGKRKASSSCSVRVFFFSCSLSLYPFCVFPLMHFRDIHMSFRSRTFLASLTLFLFSGFVLPALLSHSLPSFRTSPLTRHCMVGESHKTCMRRDTRAMNVRERVMQRNKGEKDRTRPGLSSDVKHTDQFKWSLEFGCRWRWNFLSLSLLVVGN